MKFRLDSTERKMEDPVQLKGIKIAEENGACIASGVILSVAKMDSNPLPAPITKKESANPPDNKQPKECFDSLGVKDEGYAWVVLGAMFVSNILTTGYVKGFGIIYNAILDEYPEASGTMAGVMMGLLSGCRSMFAPMAGSIANMIGMRKTMCVGATLYFVALISSYFCNTVWGLSITLGGMIGLGQCIIESCQVVVISQFFESKLSTANGIRVAGNPCGGILYPLMLTLILQVFGLRLLFVLLAAITTHTYICYFLMRPIRMHIRIKALDHVNNVFDGTNPVSQEKGLALPKSELQAKKKEMYNQLITQHSHVGSLKEKKPLDYSFLKNPTYLLFIFFAATVPMGLPLVLYYMTIYAKIVIGLTPYEITILLSFQAVFDFLLRIFIGWLNNKNLYRKSHGFVFCLWCSALGSMLMPIGTSLTSLLFIVALFTFAPASFHTFINVILSEQFGKENISSTWGFVRMTQGIFSFIHPAFIGFILDYSGGYTVPFMVMGAGMFACGCIIAMESFMTKCTEKRNKASQS